MVSAGQGIMGSHMPSSECPPTSRLGSQRSDAPALMDILGFFLCNTRLLPSSPDVVAMP